MQALFMQRFIKEKNKKTRMAEAGMFNGSHQIRNEQREIERQLTCEHKEAAAKEILALRGRTAILNASRCIKCGEVSITPGEVERARKELNPSFIHRFKEFFGVMEETAEALVFKGKVL